MIKLFSNLGGAISIAGACGLCWIVMTSGASPLGKGSVLLLCLGGIAFVVLTTIADSSGNPSMSARYRRVAMICWGIAALAMAVFALGVFLRLL